MTLEEYFAERMAIHQQIANYRIDSNEKQAQIAYNEREITKLNLRLIELNHKMSLQEELEEQ